MVCMAPMALAVTLAAANGSGVCRDSDLREATSAWALAPRMAAFCVVGMDCCICVCWTGLQPVSGSGRGAHDALAGSCCAGIADVRVRRDLCRAANDYCLHDFFVSGVLGKGTIARLWGVKP